MPTLTRSSGAIVQLRVLIHSQSCCLVELEAQLLLALAGQDQAQGRQLPQVHRLWVCCPWLPDYCTFSQKPLWMQSFLLFPGNSINIRICWNYYHCYNLWCGPATGKTELTGQLCPSEMPMPCPSAEFSGL